MIYFALVLAILILLPYLALKLETWRLRQKSSMEFASIDNHVLHDIGMTEAQRFIAVNALPGDE